MKTTICNYFFNILTSNENLSADEKEHILYRIKCIYNVLYVSLWLLLASLLLNNLLLVLVSATAMNFLRLRAGGLHASTLNRCAIISTTTLVIIPYFVNQLSIQPILLNILLITAPVLVFLTAPTSADETEIPADLKAQLKRQSTIRTIIISLLSLTQNPAIKIYAIIGLYVQIISNEKYFNQFVKSQRQLEK